MESLDFEVLEEIDFCSALPRNAIPSLDGSSIDLDSQPSKFYHTFLLATFPSSLSVQNVLDKCYCIA
jgi:hypothetical protein